ncbi:type 1 glutamine amidotransferase domain-containing protein [Marinomonas pontica]|uniref:type 1 glutamine amidotransferase domain-containing protein n=1 Tax=Marinomonas pontica TaxID=264739 RepID=UPI002244E0EC|nr:type 1 glutamine amidotransferase domain-containing protein [Marinomonas pontica]MCW8354721.1 type 1 glutamine amidotransferase domain-containing protein [Marinomonas pontica]
MPIKSKKNVLIVLTNHSTMGTAGKRTGFWLSELTHPYYALLSHDIEVDLASIQGGPAPVDPGSLEQDDDDVRRFLNDTALMAKVYTTIPINTIKTSDYDAVLFTGGHGTMWDFPNSEALATFAAEIYEAGKVVSAVCHGPAALLNIKLANGEHLISGKKVAGFTNAEESAVQLQDTVPFSLEDELRSRGALFDSAEVWTNHVVVDERLITGQNPQSAEGVGEAIASFLKH